MVGCVLSQLKSFEFYILSLGLGLFHSFFLGIYPICDDNPGFNKTLARANDGPAL